MPRVGQKTPGRPTRKKPRGSTKKTQCATSATAFRRAKQERQVVDLRLQGFSIREIAPKVRMSKSAVQVLLAEALEDTGATPEQKSAARALALGRLNAWTRALWPKTKKGDEKAITVAVKIDARRAKYEGTDAPTEQKVTVIGQLGWVFDIMLEELESLGEAGHDAAQRILRRVGAEGGPAADSQDDGS